MNEEKVREVLDFCYERAHGMLDYSTYNEVSRGDLWFVLQEIETKIEELTDDDLGR